ncbi:TRAFs-binding domain-containing protein [Nocardia fluminea]|uniref:TRAFs-binding domain-containing protein n=1 Tax=Nocardia fluminea TaxID=134984 RepID=UPI00366BAC32
MQDSENSSAKPLCFVLMPFGKKSDATSAIDFDEVYKQVIKPAVEAAGMSCLRADEERLGGLVQHAMYGRLIACDYAVADLTYANANVFYELGIRYAIRRWSTVLIAADGSPRVPFDLASDRLHKYRTDRAGCPNRALADREALTARLMEAKAGQLTDSPLFELFPALGPARVDPGDLRRFRQDLQDAEDIRERLAKIGDIGTDLAKLNAQAIARAAVLDLRADLNLHAYHEDVLIDLLLVYRGLEMWPELIELVGDFPSELARSAQVREQLALAYNRLPDGEGSNQAERILKTICEELGRSSETMGILGRVYKDRWMQAKDRDSPRQRVLLAQAIEAYVAGFELDPLDPYPGVNAVHLMWLADRADPRLDEIFPVVRYAARSRVRRGSPGYWDYATMLELSIYAGDMPVAVEWMHKALTVSNDQMQRRTTHDTIVRLHQHCGEDDEYWTALLTELAPATPPAC